MTYKVAITGRFRRGKNTVADILSEHFTKQGAVNVVQLAFADALKQEVADMSFTYAHRDVLPGYGRGPQRRAWETNLLANKQLNGLAFQWWGEFRRRNYGEDYWVRHPQFQGLYERAVELGDPVIITDMRHHNEANWAKSEGFFRVRVDGPCWAKDETRDPNHPSERHVDELEVDYVVYNGSSIDMLRHNVLTWLVPKIKQHPTTVPAANLTS